MGAPEPGAFGIGSVPDPRQAGTPPREVRSERPRERGSMETRSMHRGRLIDHLHLVVGDLAASRRFYDAVLEALDVPLGGGGGAWFWAGELFVSTPDREAA